jgi:hypothetical protein
LGESAEVYGGAEGSSDSGAADREEEEGGQGGDVGLKLVVTYILLRQVSGASGTDAGAIFSTPLLHGPGVSPLEINITTLWPDQDK